MDLPKDPMILLSFINTRLRDSYASLDDLCAELGIEKEDLEKQLAAVNYSYDPARNAFV